MDLIDVDSIKVLQAAVEEAKEKVKSSTALKIMISTEGWGILLNTFEELKENQLRELAKQAPSDEKAVLAAYAVWSATVHTVNQIIDGINFVIKQGAEAEDFLSSLNQSPNQEDDWS